MSAPGPTVDEQIDAALDRATDLRDQADALRSKPLQVADPAAFAVAAEHRMATVGAMLAAAAVYAAEAVVLSNRQAAS